MGFGTGSLEGDALSPGNEMTVAQGDVNVASAVVRSIELHGPPCKTTIAVDTDLADTPGSVLLIRR